ncbi:unnamed protein product [Knipowitschia caucasica]
MALVFLQWVCVPFVLLSPHSQDIGQTLLNNSLHVPWIGAPNKSHIWIMIDDFIFLSVGSLATPALHQRMLSSSSTRTAQISSCIAAVFIQVFGVAPVLLGAAASSIGN